MARVVGCFGVISTWHVTSETTNRCTGLSPVAWTDERNLPGFKSWPLITCRICEKYSRADRTISADIASGEMSLTRWRANCQNRGKRSPRWPLRFARNLLYWANYFRHWSSTQRREFFRWKWQLLKKRLARARGLR